MLDISSDILQSQFVEKRTLYVIQTFQDGDNGPDHADSKYLRQTRCCISIVMYVCMHVCNTYARCDCVDSIPARYSRNLKFDSCAKGNISSCLFRSLPQPICANVIPLNKPIIAFHDHSPIRLT